jgi:hypothetical protein|tara:strand:+ start:1150 stop:1281 length:132 start_codon:yes stop_codon:yes gene_type:complete
MEKIKEDLSGLSKNELIGIIKIYQEELSAIEECSEVLRMDSMQ